MILSSCKKDVQGPTIIEANMIDVPQGFPEPFFPEDNSYSHDRWLLGKKLFYEKDLSRDKSINCASCHKQENGFADNINVSPGVDGAPGVRNASTLSNVAYNPFFLSEGGSATLETQIAIPFQEHNEFDLNILLAAERLNEKPELVKLSQSAYNRAIDPFVITRAIATFERSLLTGNSDYDRYYLQDDSSAMNQSELNGLSIFNGTGKCIACHIGFNFTTYAFENNGLYEVYEDSGRFRLTEVDEDMATFKVPTLRNVEFTAPYMHDGSKETLEDVVEHYSTGIKDHPNTNTILENLNLTEQEKMDLVNFLKSLSDFDFINDPKFQP